MENLLQPKTFQCSLCSASFTRSTHLSRHLHTHTSERAHRCVDRRGRSSFPPEVLSGRDIFSLSLLDHADIFLEGMRSGESQMRFAGTVLEMHLSRKGMFVHQRSRGLTISPWPDQLLTPATILPVLLTPSRTHFSSRPALRVRVEGWKEMTAPSDEVGADTELSEAEKQHYLNSYENICRTKTLNAPNGISVRRTLGEVETIVLPAFWCQGVVEHIRKCRYIGRSHLWLVLMASHLQTLLFGRYLERMWGSY
ncbi:hypothetical protein ARMGADRAFT_1021858 [Armillaria gallica]|uniref:C2H2-type domain-containing protein n=1 Tax=Armillaria gallica TaxID=47427 RepID=A0A2H3EK74_ARMGA|nr:hypothetical protein ARMGADRAFT_1021858 [Armillaria gallica]